MQFLFPAMLLGALGISAPILIHLFNRFRYKQVEWGAMELLRKAVIIRSRKIRIEDLLLLALRCLIVIVLALALARPILTPAGAPWLGRSNDVSAVIALDASFSMDHKPGSRSRFDRACERVRDIARTLKPGNPITLIACGDRPRFVLKNEGFDAERLDARLKLLRPLPETLNVDACLDEIAGERFLEEVKSPVLEFYLVTDAQANSWQPLSEKSRQAIAQLGKAGKVFFMPVLAENSENLAITRFDLRSGIVRKGVTVDVEVGNFGKRPRDAVLTLLVNDQPVDQQAVEKLLPGKTQVVSMFARIEQVGAARLTAKLEADELLADNTRHVVVNIPDRTRVLLVQDTAEKGEDGEYKDFIGKALESQVGDGFNLTRANWRDVSFLQDKTAGGRLRDYQLVILDHVPLLDDTLVRNLYYFVKEGGGLMVFLGGGIDADLFNKQLTFNQEALLPAEVLKARPKNAKGWSVEAVEHPLSKVIGSFSSETMRNALVYQYFKLKPGPGSREVLRLNGEVDAAGREKLKNSDPLMVEHSLGRGKVILFASAARREWTNTVTEPPLIPILVIEAVKFVSRQPNERAFKVSDTLLMPLPIADREDGASVAVPPVKKVTVQRYGEEAKTTRDVEKIDGLTYARLPVVEQPGFYQISVGRPMPPLFAAVNVDARESNVSVLTTDALTETFQGLPVRLVPEGDAIEETLHENRIGRELWKEALIVLLALLVVEGLLARWITRKKTPQAPG